MNIYDISSRLDGDDRVLSARLDGDELWFRLPAALGRTDVADAFCAAALLPAMRKGESIDIADELPLSFKLSQGIYQLQDIYRAWWPELRRVSINARITDTPLQHPGYASFFSGGVDSLYTFYEHLEQIDCLIFLHGIDMQLDNTRLCDEVWRRNREFADSHAKEIVMVTSNIRFYAHDNGFSWSHQYCGAGLAAIALLLGMRYTLIPASQPFQNLYPDGSTPVTDSLFSTEATQLYYDGGIIRHEKLQYLADHPEAMSLLRVCWQDKEYNCGRCEKCLRTMLILRLWGIDCPTLPPLEDLSLLKDWRIGSVGEAYIFKNLLRAAHAAGDQEVYRFLSGIAHRESFRRTLVAWDEKFTSGKLKRAFRRLKPVGPS